MKDKKGIWMLVSLLVIISLLIGSFSCAPAAPKEETIKIGGLFELTGLISTCGVQESQAVIVALEQVGYEVAGKKIEYFEEDTGTDVAMTMDKVRKLVERDKVGITIGPTWGPSGQAMAPYLQRMQVPALAISAYQDELAPFRSFWLTTGLLRGQTYSMGVYAYEELGYRTASVMSQDWSAMFQYADGFVMGFEESGGEVIQHQFPPIGTFDYTPYIVKLEDADVLAVEIIGAEEIAVVQQLKEQGVWGKMPVVLPTEVGLLDPPMLEAVGEAAVGLVCEAHYRWGAPTTGNEEFVAAYKERWGYYPGGYAGMAYAATQVALNAIERTGGDMSYDALSKALDETDLDTVRGHVSFTEQRVGITEARIVRIVNMISPQEFVIDTIARYKVTPELVGGEKWEFHVERVE